MTLEGLRVLIAEDTASQRLVLIKQVEALGFEAVTAQDGEDALVKIEQQRPHILLTDWVMPKVDGIGVCKVTRASDAGKTFTKMGLENSQTNWEKRLAR